MWTYCFSDRTGKPTEQDADVHGVIDSFVQLGASDERHPLQVRMTLRDITFALHLFVFHICRWIDLFHVTACILGLRKHLWSQVFGGKCEVLWSGVQRYACKEECHWVHGEGNHCFCDYSVITISCIRVSFILVTVVVVIVAVYSR